MPSLRQTSAHRKLEGQHQPLAKTVRRMVRSGELSTDGLVLLETPRLIEDALASHIPVQTVLFRAGSKLRHGRLLENLSTDATVYEVAPKVFATLTTTETSPGILALANEPRWSEQDLFLAGKPSLIAVLAGLQDPGNLGTILRAAEAFGATGVLLARDTVSPFNAKAIRAAAGALFRLPILRGLPAAEIVALLRRKRVKLFATVVAGGTLLPSADLTGPVAVVFGAEGSGVPAELRAAGESLTIPMAAPADSLNVAAAAAVILYEIARQRKAGDGKS
jgi:TrmH family RNA methyltransferase